MNCNPQTLTVIPGYFDYDLTQAQIDYTPVTAEQSVDFWADVLPSDTRWVLLKAEDPIMIHSIVVASLSNPLVDDDSFIWDNWTRYAAKETMELIRESGFMDDYTNEDVNDVLAMFKDLPEVGIDEALRRNTPRDGLPTCLEETSYYWHKHEREAYGIHDSEDFLTFNPRLRWAVRASIQ
jgi:hypothetical protein